MVKKINTKEFNELNDEFIVLDVFAEGCGPCKMMAPFFEEISELDEFKNVKFCKVNVDEEEEIAELFNVSAPGPWPSSRTRNGTKPMASTLTESSTPETAWPSMSRLTT